MHHHPSAFALPYSNHHREKQTPRALAVNIMHHATQRTIWERTPWLLFILGLLRLFALIWRPFKILFHLALLSFPSLLTPHHHPTSIHPPPIPQLPSSSIPLGPQGGSRQDRFSDLNWNFDFLREPAVINLDNFPSLQLTAARMGRWGHRKSALFLSPHRTPGRDPNKIFRHVRVRPG